MSSALDILRKSIPDDKAYIGSVELPVDFDAINVLTGSANSKSLEVNFNNIREGKRLDLRPAGSKSKLASKIFGFYLKPAYEKQTAVNENLAVAFEEYKKLLDEEKYLVNRINELQVEILKLSSEQE